MVLVVNVGIKISRLARHGIQQQELRDQVLAARNRVKRVVAGVHGFVHLFEKVHHGDGFADIGQRDNIGLAVFNGTQHSRVFHVVGMAALKHHIQGVGAGQFLVQHPVFLAQLQTFPKITLGGILAADIGGRQQGHAGQHSKAGDDEFVAQRHQGRESACQSVPYPVFSAFSAGGFWLHVGLWPGCGQVAAQRRNEGQLNQQRTQNAQARENAEGADGGDLKRDQRKEA